MSGFVGFPGLHGNARDPDKVRDDLENALSTGELLEKRAEVFDNIRRSIERNSVEDNSAILQSLVDEVGQGNLFPLPPPTLTCISMFSGWAHELCESEIPADAVPIERFARWQKRVESTTHSLFPLPFFSSS